MLGILLNTHELSEFEQDILGVGRLRGRCQCLCMDVIIMMSQRQRREKAVECLDPVGNLRLLEAFLKSVF